jgi:hypothetical protein
MKLLVLSELHLEFGTSLTVPTGLGDAAVDEQRLVASVVIACEAVSKPLSMITVRNQYKAFSHSLSPKQQSVATEPLRSGRDTSDGI